MTNPSSGDPGKVFFALADPTRRRLLSMLADQPQSASALSRQFGMSRQAISKHLNSLEAAALVEPTRVGREVRFVLQPNSLRSAREWMEQATSAWEKRLDRLELDVVARSSQAGRQPPQSP